MLTRTSVCTNVAAGPGQDVCPVRQLAALRCVCRRYTEQFRNLRTRPNRNVRVSSRSYKAVQSTAQPDAPQQVFEYFVLFKVREGIDDNAAETMLDDFWSLQYMIPAGILNGFAGSLQNLHKSTAESGAGMTHALHFRFQSMQHIDKFREHERLEHARQKAAADICDVIVEAAFPGEVPRDLGQIFRRGSEWDLGVDHILLMQAAQDASEQEMQKFLAALAQLSHSSSVKALQTTYGPLQVLAGQASSVVGSHVMFTRLSLQEQVDSLLSSPPYIALAQGNPRLPAKIASSYAMHIEPAQTQKARTPDGQGVLGVSNN